MLKVTNIRNNVAVSICGGAIISPKFGLTAAACVANYQRIDLLAGMAQYNSPLGLRSLNANAVPHHAWNDDQNNIAVLLFSQTLNLDASISSIPVANTGTYVNAEGFVSGFGLEHDSQTVPDGILRFTKVRLLSLNDCRAKLPNHNGRVTAAQICGDGFNNLWSGVCYGDAGSPVIVMEGGSYRLVGLVNFISDGGCNQPHPFVSTRITAHRAWITCITGL